MSRSPMCAQPPDATSRKSFVRPYRSLSAAVEQSLGGRANTVLLTRVGGGVFGNADAWIDDAIVRAPTLVEHAGVDIRLVSYGQVHQLFRAITERFGG